ncbi:hypothetical protein ACKVMT_10160 [Halobacteriales archaeon Cl-PHB]
MPNWRSTGLQNSIYRTTKFDGYDERTHGLSILVMTKDLSSRMRSPKSIALYLIIGLGTAIIFPIIGPFLVASNRFRLADRLSFLPGINGTGGTISGISAIIYIIGGFLLVVGIVVAATGAVPEVGSSGSDDDTTVLKPNATPTPTPQQVSDSRRQEYEIFVQEVDSNSARSPTEWSPINETTLNITVQSDWTEIKRYSNHKHPVPESVLRVMNATEHPPEKVIVNFENTSGTWLRTVTVKEEWADPFVKYELGIDAMKKRFRNTTDTRKKLPEDASIPRFHLTLDDVRQAYAIGLREKLTNESWQPSEYDISDRREVVIGETGLYQYDVTLQSNVTINKNRVIYINILQSENNPGGHALGFVPSAWAELIGEQHYGVAFGEPGIVLRMRLKDPETGDIWHTADVRSTWAQHYNVGNIDWGQYQNLIAFSG